MIYLRQKKRFFFCDKICANYAQIFYFKMERSLIPIWFWVLPVGCFLLGLHFWREKMSMFWEGGPNEERKRKANQTNSVVCSGVCVGLLNIQRNEYHRFRRSSESRIPRGRVVWPITDLWSQPWARSCIVYPLWKCKQGFGKWSIRFGWGRAFCILPETFGERVGFCPGNYPGRSEGKGQDLAGRDTQRRGSGSVQ